MFDMDAIMEAQKKLQIAYGTWPVKDDAMRNKVLIDNIIGLQAELFEAAREFDWKAWSNSNDMDTERVKDELRDAFQFYVNCMLTVGMTADELQQKVFAKQEINWGRIHNNYKARIAHEDDVQ